MKTIVLNQCKFDLHPFCVCHNLVEAKKFRVNSKENFRDIDYRNIREAASIRSSNIFVSRVKKKSSKVWWRSRLNDFIWFGKVWKCRILWNFFDLLQLPRNNDRLCSDIVTVFLVIFELLEYIRHFSSKLWSYLVFHSCLENKIADKKRDIFLYT